MYRKTVLTAATLLLTIVIGCPAAAQQITRMVSYHDLNLTTRSGVRALHHRLRHAVNAVCRIEPVGDDVLKSQDQMCREEVSAAIKPKMAHAIARAEERAAATEFAAR